MTLWRRAAAPLLGVAAALALLIASRGLGDVAPPGQLSPAFWPRLLLAGLALACLAKAWQDARAATVGGGVDVARPFSRGRLAAGVGAIAGYVVLTPWLGFPITTAAFIAGFMWLCGGRGLFTLAANAVVGTVLLLYLFVKLVYLPLAKGAGPFEDVTIALLRALRIF
ncbi:MAG: tripartite tricarboxylate transporter TctB family protein [Candidatus Rokubacteria bacterium]|nr:tripartite tricarboxylate transporter TctB family protein [Candidatus Rokubacteria bacterium]